VQSIIPTDYFDDIASHKNRTPEDTLNDRYSVSKGLNCSPGWRFTPATDAGKELRKQFPGIQYWGVTEYNQEQTQPHFHFILGDDKYIPQPVIKEIWEKVQRWAGFESIAWNVYIEEIKDESDIQRYFTKYLTKLTGGKNEIPDREKWKGRYVRYSKKFFQFSIDIILTALFVQTNISNDTNYRTYYKVHPKLIADYRAQDDFVAKCQAIEERESEFINREWNPQRDKEIAYEQLRAVDSQLTMC
jgi:hypothetical protein